MPTLTRSRTARPAACALLLATPVATWWLVGDQSTVSAQAGPDYAVRPWNISPRAESAAGIGSLALAVVMMLVLVRPARRHMFDVRWWGVLVPVLAAGVVAGVGWRVLTAGVIGANIGAGLMVIFGGPLVAVLLLGAAARSAGLLSRARRGGAG